MRTRGSSFPVAATVTLLFAATASVPARDAARQSRRARRLSHGSRGAAPRGGRRGARSLEHEAHVLTRRPSPGSRDHGQRLRYRTLAAPPCDPAQQRHATGAQKKKAP
jgi:hypothetical protein